MKERGEGKMRMGIKNEMEYIKMVEKMSNEELGKIIRGYMDDSSENNWEGFSRSEVVGIRKMLGDIKLYKENSGWGKW